MKLTTLLIAGMMSPLAIVAQAQPAPGDGGGPPPPRQGPGGGPGGPGGPDGQRGPGRPEGDQPGGPQRREDGGGGGGGGGRPGFGGGGGFGRPGMGGGGGGGGGVDRFEAFRGYLDAVDRYARLSRDPATAGVAAVITAGDILRPRGPQAVIEFFNKLLPTAKNETVQRAIRLQLIDLYKQTNEPDKAIEQIQALIASVPEQSGTGAAPAPAGR